MSLKDRLNSANQNVEIQEIKKEPTYYESSTVANNTNSLGIIDTLLADDEINKIFARSAKNIYIEKKGKNHKSTSNFRDEIQYESTIAKYIQQAKNITSKKDFYSKINHKKGVNIEFIIPPVSQHSTLTIKIYRDKFANIQTLETNQSISKEVTLILDALCSIKSNVLIIGQNNTLKTTLLSAISKKIPTNHRACVIDFSQEIEEEIPNCAYYNFELIEDEKEKIKIFNSISSANPDKIFINDMDDIIANAVVSKENKNLFAVYNATTIEEAIEKIAYAIVRKDSSVSLETAKIKAIKTFNIVILAQREESGLRRISKLCELKINPNKELEINEIFNTNNFSNELKSTGYTPDFYELIKSAELPINSNIFGENYKHTYIKQSENTFSSEKRNLNAEILKKFKKDLPAQENIEIKNEEKPSLISPQEALKIPFDENVEVLYKETNIEKNSMEEFEFNNPNFNPQRTMEEIQASILENYKSNEQSENI